MWKLPFCIHSEGSSDIGLVRENNEDFFTLLPLSHFFLLADGMGGHKAGEIASKEAILFTRYAFEEYLVTQPPIYQPEKICQMLRSIIQDANEWIYHLGKKYSAFRGMGTTLCSVLFYDEFMIHAHVGDSRIYCFRENALSLLTRDHSLENELQQQGSYFSSDFEPSQYKNILTRAIGTTSHVDVDIKARQVLPGDLFLLCSDGLSDYVEYEKLIEILSLKVGISKKIHFLIESAKENGGNDNITLILIQVDHDTPKNLFR